MLKSRAALFGAVLAAGSLVVAPMAFASPASRAATTPVRVSGPSPFKAGCNGPKPLVAPYANAEVEPWVAADPRNPRHLISVYQEDRYPNDGANGVLASVSWNGGRTWKVSATRNQPHFARCEGGNAKNGGDFQKTTDPWVDISKNGTAYFVSVSYNDTDNATAELVSRSKDGGRSWGRPISLVRENIPDVIDDRPSVTADRLLPRNAYAVWERQIGNPKVASGSQVVLSRTTNDGASWSKSRAIYQTPAGMETSANQIVELPNGTLVDIFNQLASESDSTHPRHDSILEIRSTDHGRTWSKPTTVATNYVIGVTDPKTKEPIRVGDSFTHIAVDPRRGTLYAVWADARFSGGKVQQIAFARSRNGGRTWSTPKRVSTGAGGTFVPAVAVSSTGTVAVVYYQLTHGVRGERLPAQYWITTSSDRGVHWHTRHQLTTRPFDMTTAPFDNGYFLGEYEGFTDDGRGFVATATFTNDHSLGNPTDIYAVSFVPRR